MAESKWISFEEQPQVEGKKTKTFLVIAKESQKPIGTIKWYGAFHKYSLFPNENTIWETDCLTDVTNFLNKLMEERKNEKLAGDKS